MTILLEYVTILSVHTCAYICRCTLKVQLMLAAYIMCTCFRGFGGLHTYKDDKSRMSRTCMYVGFACTRQSYMYVCIRSKSTQIYTHRHTHTHTHTQTHTHLHDVFLLPSVFIHVRTHTHTHTPHTHTQMYTHTHTVLSIRAKPMVSIECE